MKKPLVGITASCLYESSLPLFLGYERMYSNTDYINAVLLAGGVPVILPILEDEDLIKFQLENLGGIIIMGGFDVSPQFFNEEPHSSLGRVLPKRDIYELALIKMAKDKKIPLLGICRGLQIMNVAFGGTLYQDLSLIKRDVQIKHDQNANPTILTHSIKTEKDSIMHKVYGDKGLVNSFHHMAVKDVARGFRVTAKAPDQIVEAIEYEGDQFIMGVQFHPEMTAFKYEPSLNLFKEFIKNC